nr:hypothetical protein [Tanacetum cinerariifolium]
MAEENILTLIRTDEQFVPVKACLPIGKSNLLMGLQKKQKNPIFFISVDIMQNTNFFRAFTASTDVPSIYVQQFWNTFRKDDKTGVYSFQLDELWFDLNADILRNALGITPKYLAHPLMSPLASKTSGSNKPRHPTLQMLWGVVTGTNVDYIPIKKPNHPVIPYFQFTKWIIYYLGGRYNIYRRPQSPVHIMTDDYLLGNLEFVSKEGVDEVFGIPIPKDLIINAIQNSEYYKKYLDMVARKPRQLTTMTDEEGGKKKAHEADSNNDVDNVTNMELFTNKADNEILNVDEEHGEEVSHTLALEEITIELDEVKDGSNPEEPGKANVETKVKSIVTVPIHQASSSAPPPSTPIIDLTTPKLVSPPV